MSFAQVQEIANAVLYEGYILYPYRPSSVKNRQRWTFGGVFPRSFSEKAGGDPWTMTCECLLRGHAQSRVAVRVRFLHLVSRQLAQFDGSAWRPVSSLDVDGKHFLSWEEAAERNVDGTPASLSSLLAAPLHEDFSFAAKRESEILHSADGDIAGAIERSHKALSGRILLSAAEVEPEIYQIHLCVENTTPLNSGETSSRGAAQPYAFASTHAILHIEDGEFLSLTDPPDALAEAAKSCINQGCWPVLAGKEGSHDVLLASPIILYDYPQIAPESPGDLFDGTEIDEILSLRILTMTDAEKREAAAADPRVAALLARTEALTAEGMAKLHGTFRAPGAFPKPEIVSLDGDLAVGARVRVKPKPGGDIFDAVLSDKIAIVEAIERDFEDRVHVAVTMEDDPGRDLGLARFPGHRFFFSREELEPIVADGAQ